MVDKIKKIKNILHGLDNGKIYLFGASITGEKVYRKIIEYIIPSEEDKVVAFVDNNPELQGMKLLDIKIINKYDLKKCITEEDIILITSNKFIPISKDLEMLGIKNYIKCDELFVSYCFHYEEGKVNNKQPWEKAIMWLLNNIVDEGGFRATSNHYHAYPEVTGYIIPTMINYGYYDEAKTAVKWLLSIQKKDGAFCGIPGTIDEDKEYVFDSGQILRGLLEFTEDKEIGDEIEVTIRKTCEYLVSQMLNEGKGGYLVQYPKESFAVEPILIYTLAPLIRASRFLNEPSFEEHANNCLNYYMKHPDYLTPSTLTHFLAYQMEALIELERKSEVVSIMEYIKEVYKEKGFIPGVKDAKWTCSTGNAQIAVCCYLLGENELANNLFEDLEKLQLSTGGFMGSYGDCAEYFPSTEISWANKYFLDANRLRIQEWFNDNVSIFPTDINEDQAEFRAVENVIKDGMCIAEIGCGKGRFLKLLYERFNDLILTGVDISKEMIDCLPDYVVGIVGTLEHIPLEDNKYDVVLCIEAIEHSVNVEVSVKELSRILKKNGTLIIIDKNAKHWGRMECPSWEQWFEKDNMVSLMKKYCAKVECETINLYGQKNDDMFLMWKGIK